MNSNVELIPDYPEVTKEYYCHTKVTINNEKYDLLFQRKGDYGTEPYLVLEVKTGIHIDALKKFNWNYQSDSTYINQLLSHDYLENSIIYYFCSAADFCEWENRGDTERIRYYDNTKKQFFETYHDCDKNVFTKEINSNDGNYILPI